MKLKHIYSLLFFNLFFGLILATNLGVFNYDIEKPIGSFTKSETSLPLTGDISVGRSRGMFKPNTRTLNNIYRK